MIHTFDGSVFNAPAAVITNTVNCEGVMGAGLALEFALRHSDLQADYEHRCQRGSVRLGRPYLFPLQESAPYRAVLNFPTKKHWRFPSRLEWIEEGLAYIATNYRKASPPITSLALPRLGCDKGGLEWFQVLPLIESHLGALPDLTVYLCGDTAAAAGVEAVMLSAYKRDHQAGELPPFIKGKVRTALLRTSVPARFRQLTSIAGVGSRSYARLFQHYYRLGDTSQLSLLPIAAED